MSSSNNTKYCQEKKTFVLNSVDDVAKLPKSGIKGSLDDTNDPYCNEPCAIGSEAIVRTGEVYILWPNNEWGLF